MARKPKSFQWVGYTADQVKELDFIDFIGNNGWARNSQTDAVMTSVLGKCEQIGLGIEQIIAAMRSIGYSTSALHMLERWESKRTTGKFGR